MEFAVGSSKWRTAIVVALATGFGIFVPEYAVAQGVEFDISQSELDASLRSLEAADPWARNRGNDNERQKSKKSRIKIIQPDPPALHSSFRLEHVDVAGASINEMNRFQDSLKNLVRARLTQHSLLRLLDELNHLQAMEGTPFRSVYVASQDLENGVLTIGVASGRLAKIQILGASTREQNIIHDLAHRELTILAFESLERFAELAAIKLGRPILVAVAPGASKYGALVEVNATPTVVEAELGFDNQALVFVGRESINAKLTMDNVFLTGDEFTIAGFAAIDLDQLRFYRIGYEIPLFENGPELIIGAGRFELKPGVAFLKSRGFELKNDYTSVHLKQKVYEDGKFGFALKSGLLRRDITREIANASTASNTIWSAELSAQIDIEDQLWGVTELDLTYTRAVDVFDATPKGQENTLRRGLGAGESAWNIDFEHKIEVLPNTGLLLSLYKQIATGPLIGPQQCRYGDGPFGRGYDPGELIGDACLLAAVKIEMMPAALRFAQNNVTVYFATDYGTLRLKSEPDPNAPVSQALQSSRQSVAAGIEIDWGDNFTTIFQLAKPFQESSVPGLEDKPTRYVFEISATF